MLVSFVCTDTFVYRTRGRVAAARTRCVPSAGGGSLGLLPNHQTSFKGPVPPARIYDHVTYYLFADVRLMIPPTPSTILYLGLVGCASRYLIIDNRLKSGKNINDPGISCCVLTTSQIIDLIDLHCCPFALDDMI